MGKFKKCPRCELNWIPAEEEICEVCKAELGRSSKIRLIDEDADDEIFEERICPVCKVNYLADDEDVCASCRAEQPEKKIEKVEDDSWEDFIEDDEPIAPEENEISLSLLQEEEEDDDEEEEVNDVDDFDESITEFDGGYDEDEDDEDDKPDDKPDDEI